MLYNIKNCILSIVRRISLFHQNNKRYEINNNSNFVNKVMNDRIIVHFHTD